ncbi:MAG: hypothetical protein Q8O99_04735 [bacterium]|nr:hypothetical protein [bacterium]
MYKHNGETHTETLTCGQDDCILGIVMENSGAEPQYVPVIKFSF